MPARRKPPPEWWLLGYLAQYQRQILLEELRAIGLSSDEVYAVARQAALKLPNKSYRRLSKSWAVRQLRARKSQEELVTEK